jgi:hypothetical protein
MGSPRLIDMPSRTDVMVDAYVAWNCTRSTETCVPRLYRKCTIVTRICETSIGRAACWSASRIGASLRGCPSFLLALTLVQRLRNSSGLSLNADGRHRHDQPPDGTHPTDLVADRVTPSSPIPAPFSASCRWRPLRFIPRPRRHFIPTFSRNASCCATHRSACSRSRRPGCEPNS